MRNKKILLLCKETSTYPLYLLTPLLQQDGNTIASYFFMAPESMYDACDLNRSTYFEFKKLKNVKVYDFKKYGNLFLSNINDPQYDKKYVKWIEKEFTHFKPLGLQLISSQFTTRHYHFRNYISSVSYEQQILFLEYYYKNTLEIIEIFNPDVILDFDDSEFARTAINEISYKYKIPYITVEHPRFEKYKLPTFQQGIGIDNYFKDSYRDFSSNHKKLNSELLYIREYNQKNKIMPDEYKGTTTSNYTPNNLSQNVKKILAVIRYFYNQNISKQIRRLKKNNAILFPNSYEYIKFYFRVEYLRNMLLKDNKYFENPVQGEKYIYMPLHLIPESTTFVKAPFYVNELHIIEAVSKTLPIGVRLYVKEHQAMLGERGLEFYKQINKLPNVRLVQTNFYKDPKPWINHSMGVITIAGTTAFEAALLGKASIVFADVPHSLISSVSRIRSFEDLAEELQKLISYETNDEDTYSCAAYIAAVKKEGTSIEYKYLMSEGERIVKKTCEISTEYKKELIKLKNFYYKAYNKFESR